jgi:hypothetical protein
MNPTRLHARKRRYPTAVFPYPEDVLNAFEKLCLRKSVWRATCNFHDVCVRHGLDPHSVIDELTKWSPRT